MRSSYMEMAREEMFFVWPPCQVRLGGPGGPITAKPRAPGVTLPRLRWAGGLGLRDSGITVAPVVHTHRQGVSMTARPAISSGGRYVAPAVTLSSIQYWRCT